MITKEKIYTKEERLKFFFDIVKVISKKSIDPYTKVGAIILNKNGEIVSAGYNSLPKNLSVPQSFWSDRDYRRQFMVHAEINALSFISQGEGLILYCTHSPCVDCLKACLAHGIEEIYYIKEYEGERNSSELIALLNNYSKTPIKIKGYPEFDSE